MTDLNTVIEGTVKFRDGKKWKSRWCVMRKLSPVADCLHLQLYRDSKDRYKHGQTKASLSLQHFLGVESGFTLDKESNTIAIICQDVTVVLAFDTRERLIQWQVKISSNLGDDQQFLIQIASCPPKSKISSGPARLHVQDLRFSMTTGVPPRLVGVWELRHLRKYGVIENRFCYEGGSRCGKGEGLFVCFTDQGDEITRCMNLAAESKLASRKKFLTRNMSVLESPSRRGLLSRIDSRVSEYGDDHNNSFNQHSHERNNDDNMCWPSSESQLDNSDFGDTASVGDFQDSNLPECTWVQETAMERCVSCISKLGALSRSSTMANTPGTIGFNPAWTMDNNVSSLNYIPEMNNGHQCCGYVSSLSSSSGASAGCSSVCGTEYSVPRKVCAPVNDKTNKSLPDGYNNAPNRPPKPVHLKPETSTPAKKAPMPLPQRQETACACRCSGASEKPGSRQSYLDNYDTPKAVCTNTKQNKPYPSVQDEYYDTPRNIKSVLEVNPYGNYDTPPSPVAVHKKSNSGADCVPPKRQHADAVQCAAMCPCRLAMACWSRNWMAAMPPPHCRANDHQNGRPADATMPTNCQSPNGAIYATVDVTKKKKHAEPEPRPPPPPPAATSQCSSNYMNLEPVAVADCNNYTNLEFSESLCLYENAKHVLAKAGVHVGGDACDKCGGHKKQQRCAANGGGDEKNGGDYMTMEPVNGRMAAQTKPRGNPFPGYLPMCPAGGCNKQQDILKNIMNKGLAGKSASIPSLNEQHKQPAAADGSDGGDGDVPVFGNKALDGGGGGGGGGSDEPRKRSSSAGSSSRRDGPERPVQHDDATAGLSVESVATDKTYAAAASSCSGAQSDDSGCSGTVVRDDRQTALVHIRRSSSVPCKNNRDSSSSNDSGVSTGSLRYRGADFAEFELPLTTAMSTVRHRRVAVAADPGRRRPGAGCVHGSLPRRSKSIDRLKDLGGGGFRSAKCAGPVKSTSAGAEVPVCLKKDDKGFNVLHADGNTVPFLDSQSTSSYTSDMSDYIETLSLSSHSSSDTNNDHHLRFGRPAKTTLKPRSGKEYHQIGFFMDGDLKVKSNIQTVSEKSETPSQRYSTTAQESNMA